MIAVQPTLQEVACKLQPWTEEGSKNSTREVAVRRPVASEDDAWPHMIVGCL